MDKHPQIHDVVKAYPDNETEFFVIGRIVYVDYQTNSMTPYAYGVLYEGRQSELKEVEVLSHNAEVINRTNPHMNGTVFVPTIDECEQRFYETKTKGTELEL